MKKGFTLIEVLVVIAILGIIAIIAVPAVSEVLKNSNNSLYNAQIKSIEDSADNFIFDYYGSISNLDEFTIELNLIKKLAYIDSNIINTKTGAEFSNNSLITFTKNSNNYEEEFYVVNDTSNLTSTEYSEYIVLLNGGYLFEVSVADISNVLIYDLDGNPVTGTSITTNTIASIVNAGYTTVTYSFTLSDGDYYITRDEKE